jgi:hypothetical protein
VSGPYIVHWLDHPHHLSPSTRFLPRLKQFKRFLCSMSCKYMNSINRISWLSSPLFTILPPQQAPHTHILYLLYSIGLIQRVFLSAPAQVNWAFWLVAGNLFCFILFIYLMLLKTGPFPSSFWLCGSKHWELPCGLIWFLGPSKQSSPKQRPCTFYLIASMSGDNLLHSKR